MGGPAKAKFDPKFDTIDANLDTNTIDAQFRALEAKFDAMLRVVEEGQGAWS